MFTVFAEGGLIGLGPGFEELVDHFLADADAGVAHLEAQHCVRLGARDKPRVNGHLALLSELDAVAD